MLPENLDLSKTEYYKSSDVELKKAFIAFLDKPKIYKQKYLQTHFNSAFDGYSYMGQKDSINQYDTDLLYSFVLSRCSDLELFPVEFHSFLTREWDNLIFRIKEIEENLIDKLNISGLADFYNKSVTHMVSCNYYPPITNTNTSSFELRLSEHVDVSLFTVFVFGISEGFSYQNLKDHKQVLQASNNIIVFPGYFLEYLSNGRYKALRHQVEFLDSNIERFSFAFFSIPKPFQNLEFQNNCFTSENYYKNYLSLF